LAAYALWERVDAIGGWTPQAIYPAGGLAAFEGRLYRVMQAHQAQPDWAPPSTSALWALVHTGSESWEPQVPYVVDDVVVHQGRRYRARQAHRSQTDWAPDRTPALWQPLTSAAS
jgi:LmbE family N-acetylglucosaminyl deacetylase